jgi:hypothetical protein
MDSARGGAPKSSREFRASAAARLDIDRKAGDITIKQRLEGGRMTDRSWYIAIDGRQAGPYPEDQFLEFIADGQVDRNALVWSEGMPAWQRAGYVPGLFPPAQPPGPTAGPGFDGAPSRGLAAQPSAAAVPFHGAMESGNHFEAEFSALPFFGRSLLYAIGMALIVTAPWAAAGFYRWVVARIRVPGRPNLAFEGKAGDIWLVIVLIALPGLGAIFSLFLTVRVIRWIVSNISSDGRRLPLTFNGGAGGYIGWVLLTALSLITIIGWAWVAAAMMRWLCRNIAGSTRSIAFTGSGWQILWRTWVFGLVAVLIIPIPWIMRWYYRWYVSQIAVG